jgi:hypothetical protein
MALEDAFELAKGSLDDYYSLTCHQPTRRQFNRALGTTDSQFVNYPLWYYGKFFTETDYLTHSACIT